jgi:hypothetical protein
MMRAILRPLTSTALLGSDETLLVPLEAELGDFVNLGTIKENGIFR